MDSMDKMDYSIYSKNLIVHVLDYLEEDDQRKNTHINCDKCKASIHAINNETMQVWIETEFGNYCTDCFKLNACMDYLEESISHFRDSEKT